MTLRALVAMIAALVAVAPSAARSIGQTPTPPRSQNTPAAQQTTLPAGTGAIVGTVTSVTTGRPVRGARLTLDGTATGVAAAPAISGAIKAGARTVLTDDQGRFAFTALPPGRFLLDAAHAEYLPASYGQKKPGKLGAPIDLGDGQHLELQVPMTRGSAISGTVVDEFGDTLMRARVRVLRYLVNQNGVRRLRVVNEVQTDDRGVYRFFNLDPGDYIVAATPAFPAAMDNFTTISDVGMSRDGVPVPPVPGYAPTYYPSSSTAAAGVSLSMDGVAEQTGVDVHVLSLRNAIIQGNVTGIPGSSVAVQVLLHNTDPAEEPTSLTATVKPNGEFTLREVPPGQYFVYAQTTMPGATQTPVLVNGVPVDPVQATRMAAFDRLHGRAAVTVADANPPPVSIVLQPGRSISGRVVLDLAQPPTGAAAKAGTTISITPAPQPTGLPAFNTSPTARVDADGNFLLPGIRPGRYFLRATGPGTVRSVMWNEVDTLDFPLEVTPEADITGVVITLTDRVSELSGTVSDSAGKPGFGSTVIAVSTDRRHWVTGSRRVATSGLAADGRYTFRGLPSGEYRVAAVVDFDPGNQFDVNFLQQIAGASTIVTIAAGSKHVQDLRVATAR